MIGEKNGNNPRKMPAFDFFRELAIELVVPFVIYRRTIPQIPRSTKASIKVFLTSKAGKLALGSLGLEAPVGPDQVPVRAQRGFSLDRGAEEAESGGYCSSCIRTTFGAGYRGKRSKLNNKVKTRFVLLLLEFRQSFMFFFMFQMFSLRRANVQSLRQAVVSRMRRRVTVFC